MQLPRLPWLEILLAAALGTGSGWAYRAHRAAEAAWTERHYRLDESIGFPAGRAGPGIPFRQQHVFGAGGERIDVPLPPGQELDVHGATWWSLDETGRMRLWNEARDEVFPTVRARADPEVPATVGSP